MKHKKRAVKLRVWDLRIVVTICLKQKLGLQIRRWNWLGGGGGGLLNLGYRFCELSLHYI